jgi:hypothetical protein
MYEINNESIQLLDGKIKVGLGNLKDSLLTLLLNHLLPYARYLITQMLVLIVESDEFLKMICIDNLVYDFLLLV